MISLLAFGTSIHIYIWQAQDTKLFRYSKAQSALQFIEVFSQTHLIEPHRRSQKKERKSALSSICVGFNSSFPGGVAVHHRHAKDFSNGSSCSFLPDLAPLYNPTLTKIYLSNRTIYSAPSLRFIQLQRSY
jgi:hypothetical protein